MSTASSPNEEGPADAAGSNASSSEPLAQGKSNDPALSSALPMSKESALIHLFEKMGVPLINAIAAVQLWQDLDQIPDADGKSEDAAKETIYATNLASLLNRSVSLSTALSEKLELSPTGDQKHRLDIASISTLMIAHQYALKAKIPEEKDIPQITSSLESVLSFADYFSRSEDMVKEASLTPDALLVNCVESVVPLVQTLGRFSFGRNEKSLLSEILNTLGERVDTLVKAFGQDMKDRNLSGEKIQIFKGCAQLLTLCYESEMNALIHKQGGDSLSQPSAPITDDTMKEALDRIWKDFDSRVTLLRAILGFVNNHFTGTPAQAEKVKASAKKTPSSSTADQKPASFSPIQAILERAEDKDDKKSASASTSSKETTEDSDNADSGDKGEDDGNYNPMSFFTGK